MKSEIEQITCLEAYAQNSEENMMAQKNSWDLQFFVCLETKISNCYSVNSIVHTVKAFREEELIYPGHFKGYAIQVCGSALCDVCAYDDR